MAKKNNKIQTDLKVLETTIKTLNIDKQALCLALLDKAIYLNEKLAILQEDMDKNGLNVEMCQGSYSITRANPSCTTYNSFLKMYTSIIKQINEELPAYTTETEDEFDL